MSAAHEMITANNQLFERDLGLDSPMKLPRGPNKLWTEGGLLYALPMR